MGFVVRHRETIPAASPLGAACEVLRKASKWLQRRAQDISARRRSVGRAMPTSLDGDEDLDHGSRGCRFRFAESAHKPVPLSRPSKGLCMRHQVSFESDRLLVVPGAAEQSERGEQSLLADAPASGWSPIFTSPTLRFHSAADCLSESSAAIGILIK